MTDPTRPALGLSVGATRLAAVTQDRSVIRGPEVVLAGQPVSDFVDRVGDPVGILAADGSMHFGEALLAEALRALASTATAGRPLPELVAVTHPAHWRPAAVDALRRAMRRIPAVSADPLLVPDAAAALTALRTDPGLPSRGVVALCDFGGSGTNLTLADAATLAPIGATVRHLEFCGDLIDSAVLAHVVGEASGGSVDVAGTSAIESLSRLRAECRAAKERLSGVTGTALPVELPGFRGDVRLTRAELDELIRQPLAEVVAAIRDIMSRNGVRSAELVAVASVGGGAVIPAVTTSLSEHFRVPLVTTARPGLIPAIGAALTAVRPGVKAEFSVAVRSPGAGRSPVAGRALAWSEAPAVPELVAVPRRRTAKPQAVSAVSARPRLDFAEPPAETTQTARIAWYRRPLPVVAAALGVIVAAGLSTVVALRSDSSATPLAPTPSITTAPSTPFVASPATPEAIEAPAPPTLTEEVEAPPVPEITDAGTVISTAASIPPPAVGTTTANPAPPVPQIPDILQIPEIPPIPQIPTIPGLAQIFLPQASG